MACGFTDDSKFRYKLINTSTEECRHHSSMLQKGNLQRIKPETDNVAECIFNDLHEKNVYGIIWEYSWVFGFTQLTAFQLLFCNTS